MTLLLDTHALFWWATEPDRLGAPSRRAIEAADELAVAAYTWWELAWMARSGRIGHSIPPRALIAALARDVRTVPLTPAIATAAAELPDAFPKDPGDRLIYATAVEHGWPLVSKDGRLHAFDAEGAVVIW
jgi:PIN domain nuclease of toxin-antitoxin system